MAYGFDCSFCYFFKAVFLDSLFGGDVLSAVGYDFLRQLVEGAAENGVDVVENFSEICSVFALVGEVFNDFAVPAIIAEEVFGVLRNFDVVGKGNLPCLYVAIFSFRFLIPPAGAGTR